MFRRILILSASVGNGHTTAAQALKSTFEREGLAEEVRHEDVLKFTNPLFRRLYGKAYIDLVNSMPEVLGWMYDQLDEPWKNEKRRLFFDKLNTQPLIKMIRDFDPDWVVCTHFLPSELISDLKGKGKLTCPQAVVVTDFDMHALWLCRNLEQYFVALDETRFYIESLGFPPDQVSVTGIPIDAKFSIERSKKEMREKFGLDPTNQRSSSRSADSASARSTHSLTRSVRSKRLCRSWRCAERTKSSGTNSNPKIHQR